MVLNQSQYRESNAFDDMKDTIIYLKVNGAAKLMLGYFSDSYLLLFNAIVTKYLKHNIDIMSSHLSNS
jgi:hypothetical protein